MLSRDLENDMTDKIHFTIESFESSMIFFLHTVDITSDRNLQKTRKEFLCENLYISIINNTAEKTEEILLVNMEDIECTLEEKMTKI